MRVTCSYNTPLARTCVKVDRLELGPIGQHRPLRNELLSLERLRHDVGKHQKAVGKWQTTISPASMDLVIAQGGVWLMHRSDRQLYQEHCGIDTTNHTVHPTQRFRERR